MTPYTTMGQARIQKRDIDTVLFTDASLPAVYLAALHASGMASPASRVIPDEELLDDWAKARLVRPTLPRRLQRWRRERCEKRSGPAPHGLE